MKFSTSNSTPVLRKLRVNWEKLPFCLLDVWVPDLGSQQSKFLSALFWANLNYTLLSKQFISKLYISTLLVNKNSLLRSFLAIVIFFSRRIFPIWHEKNKCTGLVALILYSDNTIHHIKSKAYLLPSVLVICTINWKPLLHCIRWVNFSKVWTVS